MLALLLALSLSAGAAEQCPTDDLEACVELASRHMAGEGVPMDHEKAAGLYQAACEGGYARSCVALGLSLREGVGRPEDKAAALKHFTTACEAGVGSGCTYQGMMVTTGQNTPADPSRGAALLEKGCELEFWDGCVEVGRVAERTGTPEGLTRAAEHYRLACDHQVHMGCTDLGTMMMRGRGVPKQPEQAIKLWSAAYKANTGLACWNQAVLTLQGKHPAPVPEPGPLLDQACRLGGPMACKTLGLLLTEGKGMAKNPVQGMGYMALACKGADAEACGILAIAYGAGLGVDKDPKQAEKLLKMACELGDSVACNTLKSKD
jgi:TPR repeat protein